MSRKKRSLGINRKHTGYRGAETTSAGAMERDRARAERGTGDAERKTWPGSAVHSPGGKQGRWPPRPTVLTDTVRSTLSPSFTGRIGTTGAAAALPATRDARREMRCAALEARLAICLRRAVKPGSLIIRPHSNRRGHGLTGPPPEVGWNWCFSQTGLDRGRPVRSSPGWSAKECISGKVHSRTSSRASGCSS